MVSAIQFIDKHEGGLDKFSKSYKTFGMNLDSATGNVVYREWAPNAIAAHLIGDFSKTFLDICIFNIFYGL